MKNIIIAGALCAIPLSAHATGNLFDYLDEHIATQQELDATNQRIDDYAGQGAAAYEGLQQRNDGQDARVDQLESEGRQAYDNLQARNDSQDQRVDSLESQGRAAYDELSGQDQAATQDRNDLRQGQEQNTDRIDDNATTNAEQAQTLDSHDQRIGAGEQRTSARTARWPSMTDAST